MESMGGGGVRGAAPDDGFSNNDLFGGEAGPRIAVLARHLARGLIGLSPLVALLAALNTKAHGK